MEIAASNVDTQYLNLLENILNYGVLKHNRTGVDTLSLIHQSMSFNLETEFPILQSKKVFYKSSIKELLWIWQLQSNDVRILQDMGVKIWNEWAREDGTIGKAYGYQIAKYKQLDNLIDTIKNNPNSRRMIVSLWNVEDLDDMALQPCAFQTLWNVTDGKLNCMLIQRSYDAPVGGRFNMAQYATLVHMIAQVCDLKPGQFTHIINDAHIYVNQIDAVKLQIERWKEYINGKPLIPIVPKVQLKINNPTKNFYEFTADDFELVGYNPLGAIKMEVAV